MADEKEKFARQILLQQIELMFDSRDKEGLQAALADQRSSDIAEIVELVNNEQRRLVFDVLDKEIAAEVLEKVGEATRDELFDILDKIELKIIVSHLNPDDATDILQELSEERRADILKSLPPEDAEEIKALMAYSEDSAGGIMDTAVISVTEDATIAEAVNKIRAAEIDEDFYSVFVVDSKGKFIGDVRIRQLLTKPENTKIKEIVETDTIYVHTGTDQEEVGNIFRNNDLIVMPVLDKYNKLVGRITADRVIEVAHEEAAEDIYTIAGTDPDELEDVSAIHAARVRMTFLLPCLIGTSVTALILIFFKNNYKFVYFSAEAF